MFVTLGILFDVLESIAGKNPASSSRTDSSPAEPASPPPAKPPTKRAKSDDLRRIEGIGPKTKSVLLEAGISTFSQLAACRVDQLKEILADAGLGTLADPSSWPEQASLAEAEDWNAFQKLKDQLQGGHRI